MPTPPDRVRTLRDAPLRTGGAHVVYWMTALRRPVHNFALERAVDLALAAEVPLIVLEPLRVGYLHASARLHRFVIDGMADNRRAFEARGVAYHPYVEPRAGAGRGLLEAMAEDAVAVVTDDWPCFFLPRMQAAAAAKIDARLEAVDGNGLLPIRQAGRAFARAYDSRRYLHATLEDALASWPHPDPTREERLARGRVPDAIEERWPAASQALLAGERGALEALPIDHEVRPTSCAGGHTAASDALDDFVAHRLARYHERNHPDAEVTSELSPWLHFGHLGTHEVLHAIAAREGWSPAALNRDARGARRGFWGMSEAAEGFLDQLVTWRELGFNACVELPDHDRYDSLPDWARRTLEEHAADRDAGYDLDTLERAATEDPIWNAAQRQLLEEGRMHNYLRMLWGKKILEWAPTARVASEWMVYLNDRYALDGRDPNSYSGIFWVLGRYDRPWGPERDVFGKIRCMTSASAARKLRMKGYLARFG